MISWFKHLLAWQQIGVGIVAGAVVTALVAVAAVTLSRGQPTGDEWETTIADGLAGS